MREIYGNAMHSWFTSGLLSIFFPKTCALCGQYIGENETSCLCKHCIDKLPRTEQAEHRQNSTEMVFYKDRKTMHIDRAAAFLFYDKDTPIQRLIHKMKYADQPEIGYQLGRLAALEFQYTDFLDEIDRIVPIPLHPKRLRERGYNQSEYIARGISDVTGIPVDTTHVTRIKNTPKQALQTGEERTHNVADAFDVNHPEQLYHQRILIVDDLITTGETMRSCIRAMKRIRGATFCIFSLCKAR